MPLFYLVHTTELYLFFCLIYIQAIMLQNIIPTSQSTIIIDKLGKINILSSSLYGFTTAIHFYLPSNIQPLPRVLDFMHRFLPCYKITFCIGRCLFSELEMLCCEQQMVV